MRDGVCFEKENAVANDTQSARSPKKQNRSPAQRSAEVVDEARSDRAVLILKGGATE